MRFEFIPRSRKHWNITQATRIWLLIGFAAFTLFSSASPLASVVHREHRREISLSFFACRVTFAAKTSNSGPETHETLLMRMRRRASDEKWLANETSEIKKGFNRKSKLIYGKDFRFRGPENDSKFYQREAIKARLRVSALTITAIWWKGGPTSQIGDHFSHAWL